MGQTSDDALEAFMRLEHPRIVGLLALHVGRREIAEELAQESMARLCQHWPEVKEMPHRRAWLTRVAINLANSSLRRRYAERRANRRHGLDESVHRDEHADVIAVRQAVSQLPRRQRTAVTLRFYEQMSVAETAEFMGCPTGTVTSLVHRAIGRLREHADLLETRSKNERTCA